jgi:5-methylcytosine-specific restriction endonuclease McrA
MAWKAANKDKVKAGTARVSQVNAARCIAWREENKESRKEFSKQWAKANAVKRREYSHTRRARISGAGGVISQGFVDRLFELQKGKCPCCNQPLGDDCHIDHIMPLALGGSNADENIQLLRATCNGQKHAKHPVDFMQSRGFLL